MNDETKAILKALLDGRSLEFRLIRFHPTDVYTPVVDFDHAIFLLGRKDIYHVRVKPEDVPT